MIIRIATQATAPAITPHQKSGMYMLSPPAPAAPGAFICTLLKIIKLYVEYDVIKIYQNSRAVLLLMGLTVFVNQKKNNGYAHIINCRQFSPLSRIDHCRDQAKDYGDKNSAFKSVF